MDRTYLRSVDELLVRYEFHPEFRDVYVEGVGDVAFYSYICRALDIISITTYSIESVEISALQVAQLGLEAGGNRVRTIALSMCLDRELPVTAKNVYCLIDLDLEYFCSKITWNRYLLYTQYSCIESFILNDRNLIRTFEVFFGKSVSGEFYETFCHVLNTVFYLRVAKRNINNSGTWFDHFTDHCYLTEGKISFDVTSCCADVATVAKVPSTAVDTHMKKCKDQFGDVVHVAIHGHDLTKLLIWAAKTLGAKKELLVSRVVQSHWLSLVEAESLRELAPFRKLLSWSKL